MKRLPKSLLLSAIAAGIFVLASSCQVWNQLFPPSVVGTWRQDVTYTATQAQGNATQFRFDVALNADKTFEMDIYVMFNSKYTLLSGSRGTYTTSDNSIVSITQTETYTVTDTTAGTGQWSAQSDTGSAKYSISGDTMTLTVDNDKNGQYDTSHPIQDTYPGGGPATDFTLTLTKITS